MRDLIARILAYILTFVLPGRGRHAADPAPSPVPVSPWSRPWSSPTKEEAQALFRKQAEVTMRLGVIRERRTAAVLATLGVDYPYSYPGDHFETAAYAAAGVSA
ncbi:hypothetical protein OG413_18345 [Streptomyces sp. NBC_01433]|uniref:hypothetical protein n=1 Tax=Streptomyces sp. NBC_01433 TaxID=2903864 RepID=UPI002250FAE5|nr:hypothetical protein [Streptomyces sp. NBC_01433]MCX4677237.1 hypothetical protein [Streptomyces sp. NBC_01433]